MKKIALVMAALAIASVFVGCGPKSEESKAPDAAGGNGQPDAKAPDTTK